MKKTAAFLLSLSMLSASAVMAFADDEAADVPANIAPGEAVINTVVPNSHKLTITVIGNGESASVLIYGDIDSEIFSRKPAQTFGQTLIIQFIDRVGRV